MKTVPEAEKFYREALRIFTDVAVEWGIAHALSNLAGALRGWSGDDT